MSRNLFVFAAISLLICLSGCFLSPSPATPPFETKIIQKIKRNCTGNAPCTLRMSSVTPFDWDKMYAFTEGTGKSDKNRILGTNDAEDCDLYRQLVFIKNGKIVFQECEPVGFEGPIKNEMSFDVEQTYQTRSYKSYSHEVVFSVTQGISKEGPWFTLKQIN